MPVHQTVTNATIPQTAQSANLDMPYLPPEHASNAPSIVFNAKQTMFWNAWDAGQGSNLLSGKVKTTVANVPIFAKHAQITPAQSVDLDINSIAKIIYVIKRVSVRVNSAVWLTLLSVLHAFKDIFWTDLSAKPIFLVMPNQTVLAVLQLTISLPRNVTNAYSRQTVSNVFLTTLRTVFHAKEGITC